MKHKNGRFRKAVTWLNQHILEPMLVGEHLRGEARNHAMRHGSIVAEVQAHIEEDHARAMKMNSTYTDTSLMHSDVYDLFGTTSPGLDPLESFDEYDQYASLENIVERASTA